MDQAEPIDGVEVGEVVGGYRLERLLGAGSVSRVFLAQHLRLGRKVAIKVLNEVMIEDARMIDRFLNEARIVNDIRHPNIVDVSDFIETESPKRLALVMEYIEGPSLKAVIRGGGRFSFAQAIGIVLQLVSACEAAHGAGVIHRDLKPDNLLLTAELDPDPEVIPGLKVVDFGIAKVGALGEKTATGMMIGTPAYMSPEQIAGKPPPSAATDVFAIGEVLYEVLTGQRAYPPGPIGPMIQAKLKGELPELATPAVPGGVAIHRIVTSCLQLRMQDRPRLEEIRETLLDVCPEAEVVLSPRAGGAAKKKSPSSEADTLEPPPVESSVVTAPEEQVGMPPKPVLEETRPEPNRLAAQLKVPLETAVSPLPSRGVAAEEPPEETKTPILTDYAPTAIAPPPPVAVRPPSRAPLIAGAAAIACVIAAGSLVLSLQRRSEIVAEPIAAQAEPNIVARPKTVRRRVQINSTPAGARVEDPQTNADLGVTPLDLLRSEPLKRVRVTLAGYESIERDVPEGDAVISVGLTKVAVKPHPAASKKPDEGSKPAEQPEKDPWKMGGW